MRLFLGVSLALCLVLLGITLFRGDALGAAVEDNLLRLRLEHISQAARPADAGACCNNCGRRDSQPITRV